MSTTTPDSLTQPLPALGPSAKHSENAVNCVTFVGDHRTLVFPPYRLRLVSIDSCETRIAEHGSPEYVFFDFDNGSVRLRGWRLEALIEAVFAGNVSEVRAVLPSLAEVYPDLPVVTEVDA